MYKLVVIALILITVSPTCASPPPPPPPPGPCKNCIDKCCAESQPSCFGSTPSDQCQWENCIYSCDGVCINITLFQICESSSSSPLSVSCKNCINNCITISIKCSYENIVDTCFRERTNCNYNCSLEACKNEYYHMVLSIAAPFGIPATCVSPNDLKCFPSGIPPIVTTITQFVQETPTTPFTTTKTTITSYIGGYQTTNSQGFTIFIPPSTLYVVKDVLITEPVAMTASSDSTTILHGFIGHILWGVAMSLAIITATLIFMIIA